VVAELLLLAVQPASAAIVLCTGTSAVDSNVISNAGIYGYQFTLINTSQCSGQGSPVIVDFELPLQSLGSVSSIVSPQDWSYQILSSAEFFTDFGISNPFASAYVLHWYDTGPRQRERTHRGEFGGEHRPDRVWSCLPSYLCLLRKLPVGVWL
jgi:hypothetical protein